MSERMVQYCVPVQIGDLTYADIIARIQANLTRGMEFDVNFRVATVKSGWLRALQTDGEGLNLPDWEYAIFQALSPEIAVDMHRALSSYDDVAVFPVMTVGLPEQRRGLYLVVDRD